MRNSFLGLILPSITSVFYIYLLKENFEQVPDELYKAAKVDGTSDLKYLWKVMIPICRPTLVTITILKLIECWNSYVWPRLITDDPAYLPGVQRHPGDPGERLWPGEHPRHDGRRGGHLRAADSAVSGLPQEDHGGRVPEEGPKDEKQMPLPVRWRLLLCLLSGGLPRQPGAGGLHRAGQPLTPADNYEITFWAKNDTNKRQTDIYRQAIAEFQELYPNITVNLRLYTDYGDIYNDVITNISTGTTPNVCITYPDHIATYLTGDNVVVPLDDLFADPHYGLGGQRGAL